jgi:hypothetical protein
MKKKGGTEEVKHRPKGKKNERKRRVEKEEENEEETEGSIKEKFEKGQQGIRKRGKITILQKHGSKKKG